MEDINEKLIQTKDELDDLLSKLLLVQGRLSDDTFTTDSITKLIKNINSVITQLNKVNDISGLDNLKIQIDEVVDSAKELLNINAEHAFYALQSLQSGLRSRDSIKTELHEFIGDEDDFDRTLKNIGLVNKEWVNLLDTVKNTNNEIEGLMGVITRTGKLNDINRDTINELAFEGVDSYAYYEDNGYKTVIKRLDDGIADRVEQIKSLEETLKMYFPNGEKGLSNVKEFDDEFSNGLSELEQYNDIIDTISRLNQEIVSLKDGAEIHYSTKGYVEMYNKVARALSVAEKFRDTMDAANDEMTRMMDGEDAFIEGIKRTNPYELKESSVKIKELEDESKLLDENRNKINSELSSDLFTQTIKDRITSEENINKIIKNRRALEEQEKLVLKGIRDTKGIETTEKLDINSEDSINRFETYRNNLVNGLKDATDVIDTLHKAQNNLNDPKSSYAVLDMITVRKVQNLKNLLSSGFKQSLVDLSDLELIATLEKALEHINEEVNDIKTNNISDDLIISTKQVEDIRVAKEQLKKYNSKDYKDKFVTNYYEMKQAEQELEILRQLKDKYKNTENQLFNPERVRQLSDAIYSTYAKYESIADKINEAKEKFKDFGIKEPKLGSFNIQEPITYVKILEKERNEKLSNNDAVYKERINKEKEEVKKLEESLEYAKRNALSASDISNIEHQLDLHSKTLSSFEFNYKQGNSEINKKYTNEISKVQKEFKSLISERNNAEQEQTRIAKQQADERVRIAQGEHQKKMSFFDKEYVYNGTEYSTGEKLEYFTNYANDIKNSQNYIGMPEVQTQQYEQAMNKVRSLQSQLDNEQKQSIDNIKNRVQEACQSIISIVSKAVDIVKFAINSIGNTFNTIISAFRGVGSIASRIIGLIGNFANRVRECTKTTNLLKGSWTELRSAISLISGAINKLMNNTFINEGKKLLASIETLNTLIGKDLTQSTIDWANNLEGAFGIDAAGLIADMREVAGVLKGLGMTAKDVTIASQNLVAVGQTMSAVIGLDEQTVMNKIYSGMRGMTTAIDDIGLSVRDTQMDSFLKKVKAMGGEYANIGTSFSNLAEQQRVYVRYTALMEQFMNVYTPEAYAKALDSISGRLGVLSQRFRALKQLIGNFAIQVFNKFVLPLTYAVDMLTAKLKGLFSNILINLGLNPEDLDLSTGMNHTTVAAEDLKDAYDDVAKSAENAAKASAGLDDWDHVSTLGSSSSTSSADSFDYTKLMELGDNYAEQLGKLAEEQANLYKEKTKKAWEELKEQIKNDFNAWYKGLTGRNFDAKFNLSVNWTQIKNIAKNIKDTIKKVFSTGLGIGAMIVDDLDLGKIITKTLSIVENITATISKAVEKISPYIINFYEQYIKPYVETFGEFIDKHLNILIGKVIQWRAFWETGESDSWLSENSDSWFESICNWIDTAIEKIKVLWSVIKPLFTGEITVEDKELVNKADNNGALSNVQDTLLYIHNIIKDIASIAGDVAVSFANWFKTTGSGEIKDIFQKLSNFFSEHKDDIKKILETYAQTKWDVFITIFDKAIEIADWIAEHSDFVCKAIETIGKIIESIVNHIIGVLALGIVAKIITVGTKLLWILSLLKGSGILGTAKNIGLEIGKWFTGIGSKIGTVANTITTKIGGAVSSIGTKISNWFTGIASSPILAGLGITTFTATGLAAGVRGWKDTMSQYELTKAVDKDKKIDSSDIISQAAATVKELRNIYGSALTDDIYAEAIRTYETYLSNSCRYTAQEISNVIDLYAYEIEQYSGAWDSVLNIQSNGFEGWADIIVDNMYTVENNTKNLSNTVETETSSMNTKFSTFGNGVWTSERNISGASISIKSSLESIKTTFESVKTLFAEQITAKFNAEFNANTNINTSNIKWTTGTKTTGLNSFYAHANGGVPKAGSLFMANENGDSELVGNFGGYTGVANQNMIMQAMENAIARGMSKVNNGNKNSGDTIIEVCKGGMFIGDNSSIRKLANMINSTNNVTNRTIANSAFSMN